MRHVIAVTVAVLAGLGLSAGAPETGPADAATPFGIEAYDPSPPLALTVDAIRMDRAAEQAEVEVGVRAHVAFARIDVDVSSLDKSPLRLAAGPAAWSVPTTRDEAHQRRISFRKEPNERRVLAVRVVAVLPNGEKVIQTQTLFTPSDTAPEALGRVRPASRGRQVLELPGRAPR